MALKDLLLSPDPVSELRELHRAGELAALEPALAALEMSIPCGWHHKDNLQHSFQVLSNAMERETAGPDLVLRTAALLHDVGKPATREFQKKGEVSFHAHESVGAKMSKAILVRHGYGPEEREAVKRLIFMHMRAYGFGETVWTDSAVRRLTADSGSETVFQRLVTIFYSDLTTTNRAKKRKVETAIARLEEASARVRAADARAELRPALNGNELMAELGLTPGPRLGKIMRFLNSDEGIALSRIEALEVAKNML